MCITNITRFHLKELMGKGDPGISMLVVWGLQSLPVGSGAFAVYRSGVDASVSWEIWGRDWASRENGADKILTHHSFLLASRLLIKVTRF